MERYTRWYVKARERERHRIRYETKASHKATDELRFANNQQLMDTIKKTYKRKATGRALKVKGQTMPTMVCSKSRADKARKCNNGKYLRGESMKVAILYKVPHKKEK